MTPLSRPYWVPTLEYTLSPLPYRTGYVHGPAGQTDTVATLNGQVVKTVISGSVNHGPQLRPLRTSDTAITDLR